MVQINFAQKSVNVKVVYYGPGMSGKTTNLEVVHQRAPEGNRGDLTSISTDGDRTLFFDFMPLDLGTVAGMRTQFQIYTVPGQVYYNSTRKLVLQGVDGVIFIADSSASMLQENLDSLRNLQQNLEEYGKSMETTPYVIQYNKRDLPDAMSMEDLEAALNPHGVPSFEAVASTGQGVFPTLKAIAARVLDTIHAAHSGPSGSAGAPEPAQSAGAPPAGSATGSGSEAFHGTATDFHRRPAAVPPPQPAAVSPAALPPAAPVQEPQAPAPLAQPAVGMQPQPGVVPPIQTSGVPAGFPQPGPAAPLQQTGFHAPPSLQQPPAHPPQVQQPQVQAPLQMQPPQQQLHLQQQPPQQQLQQLQQQQQPQQQPQQQQPAQQVQQAPPVAVAPPQADNLQFAGQQQPSVNQGQQGSPGPLMQVPQGAVSAPPPAAGQGAQSASRLKPRSARPTPREVSGGKSSMMTGVFVTLALVAGVVLGSLVFKIF